MTDTSDQDIEAIQARLRAQYTPQPGESLGQAADEKGALTGRAIVALIEAGQRIENRRAERLSRAELVMLLDLLAKMRREPQS